MRISDWSSDVCSSDRFGELGVPRSGMQLGSTEAVKQAVRAGLGVSLVMASAVQDEVRSGALVALPIPGLEKRLQLIWRKPPGNLHPPGFVRHLLAVSRRPASGRRYTWRSKSRRVGEECGRTCISRGWRW